METVLSSFQESELLALPKKYRIMGDAIDFLGLLIGKIGTHMESQNFLYFQERTDAKLFE